MFAICDHRHNPSCFHLCLEMMVARSCLCQTQFESNRALLQTSADVSTYRFRKSLLPNNSSLEVVSRRFRMTQHPSSHILLCQESNQQSSSDAFFSTKDRLHETPCHHPIAPAKARRCANRI